MSMLSKFLRDNSPEAIARNRAEWQAMKREEESLFIGLDYGWPSHRELFGRPMDYVSYLGRGA